MQRGKRKREAATQRLQTRFNTHCRGIQPPPRATVHAQESYGAAGVVGGGRRHDTEWDTEVVEETSTQCCCLPKRPKPLESGGGPW